MAGLEGLDGGTIAMILTALGTISGAVVAVAKWAHSQFHGFVLWGKPLVEQTVVAHNSLVDTLKTTQIETTQHIGQIRESLSGVEERLDDHGTKLQRIEDHRCHPNGPIVQS